jgi:hypothetical protein
MKIKSKILIISFFILVWLALTNNSYAKLELVLLDSNKNPISSPVETDADEITLYVRNKVKLFIFYEYVHR